MLSGDSTVHGGGFNPANLTYVSVRTKIPGGRRRRLGIHQCSTNPNTFWVRDSRTVNRRGEPTPSFFFVSLPSERRSNGSASVLGCTCQACGGSDTEGPRRGLIAGQAHECAHTIVARQLSGNDRPW